MKPRLLSEFYAMLMHLWPYELSQLRAVVEPAREGVLGIMSTGRRVTVQVKLFSLHPTLVGQVFGAKRVFSPTTLDDGACHVGQ